MASIRISDEHNQKVEEIQEQMPFKAPKKEIVEGLIDDYYSEKVDE